MPTRLQVLIPIGIAAVIVGVAGMLSIPSEVKLERVDFPMGTISVDDNLIQVQIADTEPRRVRGLMFQETLPIDQGMLFVFDQPGTRGMWMLNMQFALDIIWFDEHGKVVSIQSNVPPCKTPLEVMSCDSEGVTADGAKYVLEMTYGAIEKYKINENSQMEIISI
tara:strand:- start:1244 stop:1738 length:495 start_codon:yes stop_codon:yes gene_type:complete